VIAPAKTGREKSSSRVVIKIDHTNNGICSVVFKEVRMFKIVVMKLMAPKIDETPAKWSLKIVRSTDAPEWKRTLERGGYTVHPVPEPEPENADKINIVKDGGRSQNLMLFIRGKAMSWAPSIMGSSQFPNPPIKIGITIKKIMTKACAVTITL